MPEQPARPPALLRRPRLPLTESVPTTAAAATHPQQVDSFFQPYQTCRDACHFLPPSIRPSSFVSTQQRDRPYPSPIISYGPTTCSRLFPMGTPLHRSNPTPTLLTLPDIGTVVTINIDFPVDTVTSSARTRRPGSHRPSPTHCPARRHQPSPTRRPGHPPARSEPPGPRPNARLLDSIRMNHHLPVLTRASSPARPSTKPLSCHSSHPFLLSRLCLMSHPPASDRHPKHSHTLFPSIHTQPSFPQTPFHPAASKIWSMFVAAEYSV